ncbi:MAG: MmgE/PrpD family protein [Deltaproteobacteria bacterium]
MTGSVPRQLEEAAEWAAGFRLEQAPADVLELSRLQIANILAALVAGSRSAAGQKAYRALQVGLTAGPCTLMPHGERASLWDALWLHAVYANALELDDFHYRGHLGPAVVVVPLALAELLSCDGRSVLRAQIGANELAGRLGWAVNAEIRHGHQRSYLLRFAAAAAAGMLIGLDASRLATALAIAMTQPENPLHPGMFSPETKALSAAPSVVEGVKAAFLAAEGFSAARDILEHPAGFYRQFTLQREAPSPFLQLGEAWSTHALCFKRYAACAYAAGAVDAACRLRAEPGFDAGSIRQIEVASSLPALIMERLARPHEHGVLTAVNVQFSILRSVALALLRGDIRGREFTPEAFDRAAASVRALAARARLAHDWTFTIHQLKGIDAGLRHGGDRRSADMIQFYRTSGEFRRLFGSGRAIGAGDVVRLLRLPGEDRRYFARRWVRSASSHVRRLVGRDEQDPRPLGDLRQLSFRMGARVTVSLADGRRLTEECIVPTGMAGDPDRARVVREKFAVECAPAVGPDGVLRVWNAVEQLETAPAVELPTLLCGREGALA